MNSRVGRLRGMENVENDVGYLEVNTVLSGEPIELLNKCI